ncbi:MAG TPA: universal stress protein, partial [Thermoanaerobaculia bacterium]|nr:universal stress protein [Thermoanaerobaculia bacterium]
AAKLTLLHVIASIEHVPYEELADFYATLEQRAGEALEGWRQELADQGLQVGWEIVLGRRTAEIVRWAGEHEVDLIVMESHRIDPQHPTEGLATLSHQVAVLAPCPVLLVK